MKKLTLFFLFCIVLVIAGCAAITQTTEEKADTLAISELQSITLLSQPVVEEHTEVMTVKASHGSHAYLPKGRKIIVEFLNTESTSKRLVFFDAEIDLVLAPRQRAEIFFHITDATQIEYLFGNTHRTFTVR